MAVMGDGRHGRRRRGARHGQRGGALVEYAVVAGCLVLILLVPVPPGDKSAISELLDKLREAYTSFVYALSASWI